MAKIIIYKKFSDSGLEKKVKPGKAIKKYYSIQNYNHVIFMANGKKVDENYINSLDANIQKTKTTGAKDEQRLLFKEQ